ncbi:GNAT family N-acetyltransferase [Flexithrix dorotheae]|uniref:GNAT family N-acetyltransferase n=1 Tax=Flexithrix dorotheae TaxID=70993 RepID=UPI000368585F|nr:GNAT family N-acetyltransferase [Flexithrix dorotheae]
MVKATPQDKKSIVELLSKAFDTNKSVNFAVKQDHKREARIQNLVNYSFELCYMFGDVFLSDDRKAAALILYPEKKKTNLKAIWLDIQLAFISLGLSNIYKVLKRESKIKKYHPKEEMIYLWFIGVHPDNQGNGSGSKLMEDIFQLSERLQKPIYLETSTVRNIPWYKKLGFETIHKLGFGFELFLMTRKCRQLDHDSNKINNKHLELN